MTAAHNQSSTKTRKRGKVAKNDDDDQSTRRRGRSSIKVSKDSVSGAGTNQCGQKPGDKKRTYDDLIREIWDNKKWPKLRLSRLKLSKHMSSDSSEPVVTESQPKKHSLVLKQKPLSVSTIPDSAQNGNSDSKSLSQGSSSHEVRNDESEVEKISLACSVSSSQFGKRKRTSTSSGSTESKRQRVQSHAELVEESGNNDESKTIVVPSDQTETLAESEMQESKITTLLSSPKSFLRATQNLQSSDSFSQLDTANVFNADDNINGHTTFIPLREHLTPILLPDNDHLAIPSSSSGYSSSLSTSESTQVSESESFEINANSPRRTIASRPRQTGSLSGNESHGTPNSTSKRRGLANFRFRSLSNKVVR